jgi:hypothetical protein
MYWNACCGKQDQAVHPDATINFKVGSKQIRKVMISVLRAVLFCCLVLGFLAQHKGFYPRDPSQPVNLKCLLAQGYKSYLTRLWVNSTQTNPRIAEQFLQIYPLGMKSYAVIRICPFCIDPSQLHKTIGTIRSAGAGGKFLLEVTPEGWHADQAKNIAFIKEVKRHFGMFYGGLHGILTDQATWQKVFGTYTADLRGALIYHGDDKMDFDDWTEKGFAKNVQPFAKVFPKTTNACGNEGAGLYMPH